ncbi:MAG: hypothetical protein P8X51_12335 [Maritimibacter sp.]
MAGDRDHEDKVLSRVIFQNDDYILRYEGPDPAMVSRVVVTFPDLIHPAGPDAEGWGAAFLRKRGAAVLSLNFVQPDWYQGAGFFPALDAARAFLGPNVAITTYGSSMGGYGALLAAARLGADRAVALCPQFSIAPEVVPFEHRYQAEAERIGAFRHDVGGELRDDISYFVVHDPMHRVDRRHVALFPKPSGWRQIPLPGAGHGVLPTLIEMGAHQTLFGLLVGQADEKALRQAVRAGRAGSQSYLRRMGNRCAQMPRRQAGLKHIIGLAEGVDLVKFARRWQEQLKVPVKSVTPGSDEIIIHVGLPSTGTIGIQTYFAREADAMRALGLDYPLGASSRMPHHGWFGKSLLSGDFSELDRVLAKSRRPRMLLSDETIYNEAVFCDEATADALRERLAGRNLRVIVCLRDGDSWMKSFYKQAVHNKGRGGATGSAAYWGSGLLFDAFFANPEIATLARLSDMLARLERIFGVSVETIELRPGEDIVPVFLEKIGCWKKSLLIWWPEICAEEDDPCWRIWCRSSTGRH